MSEGLIFRHFGHKKGLLQAIMQDAEGRINRLFGPILAETDPQQVIHNTIALPFSIAESEYDFWRLQFKLKWEQEYDNPDKMKPVQEKLTWAFRELGYEQPAGEAAVLLHLIDAIAIAILRQGLAQQLSLKPLLINKYTLQISGAL